MQKYLIIISIFIFTSYAKISYSAPAAYAFRVKFKDKIGTLTFADSLQFLSPKSLARRSQQGIQLDSTDLPIVQSYIDTVMSTSVAIKLHNKSKWFNQIVIITDDSTKVFDIQALPMVENVKLVGRYPTGNYKTETESLDKFEKIDEPILNSLSKNTRGTSAYYGLGFQQIDIIGGDCLHDLGFKGEGMDIAVFDVGFRSVNTCNHLSKMFSEGRMKEHYDFARDTANAFSFAIPTQHGMNVMSTIASDSQGSFVGTAPKANYFIYVTEDSRFEMPIEEDNWLSAAERCDSLGVYLINASLGYNIFDAPFTPYTYADLNGKTSLVAQAANMTVAKGILVVVAQGNEGLGAWHYMLTPADADSVYSVGSIDGSGAWGGSSYGPTFTGVIKPDGVGVGKGVTVLNDACGVTSSTGSSFASPTLCGAFACLWQSLPALTNWEVRQLVKMTSSLYTNPNATLGYGVPDFCLARSMALGVGNVKHLEYQFAVYPNPSEGTFRIQSFNSSLNEFTYSITDLSGRIIFKSEVVQSNTLCNALQNKPVGNYVLNIMSKGKIYSTTILKK